MNCDEAFDLLTRGPVPAGDAETDPALERHLAACHDCRRLAEAMRPAVGLLHEVLSESDDLPCYRGELPVVSAPVAVAVRPVVRDERPTAFRSTPAMRIALCVVGLVLLAIGLLPRESTDGETPVETEIRPEPRALQMVDDRAFEQLVAMGTPLACRPELDVHGAHGHLMECCTLCHVPTKSPAPQRVKPARLVRACAVCHQTSALRHPLTGRACSACHVGNGHEFNRPCPRAYSS